ncbi:hypothetical protein D3C71_1636190 [compost metagenome]
MLATFADSRSLSSLRAGARTTSFGALTTTVQGALPSIAWKGATAIMASVVSKMLSAPFLAAFSICLPDAISVACNDLPNESLFLLLAAMTPSGLMNKTSALPS